ncbi:hypothetical protein [Variovorax sp. EBFNA2]|uniref:hypothetical protein n=1 Tax=Variovorax sp. EBFNA2 TaxID=3342097 RepID=UPI0029BFAE05|nr:hypothetical protein [Variovorax boronicumulans]WPG38213.1 hypothetical protein RZE79_02455 [Variovorax boronicumulans]
MDVSWKEKVLWKPPTARRRDALEMSYGGMREADSTDADSMHSVHAAVSALRHSTARKACARRSPSPESALPFSATVFSDTTHGDDQPPGREHHSMNRSLNT